MSHSNIQAPWLLFKPLNSVRLFVLVLVAAMGCFALSGYTASRPKAAIPLPADKKADQTTKAQVGEAYGRLPLSFEANQGQTDSEVKFLSRGNGYSLFLTSTEAVLSLKSPKSKVRVADSRLQTPDCSSAVLRMKLVGANPTPSMTGLDELPGKSNYFIGKDSAKWRTNVPTYAKVRQEAVYPGVDLVYYGNQRQLEYDFVVRPGTDPAVIALSFEGADKLEVDNHGELVLQVGGDEIRQRKPLIYQEVDGVRQEIAGRYELKDKDKVSFQIAAYDVSRPLVIDPLLVYSSYLGGSSDDRGFGIAVDVTGNAYVTGLTNSTNFPTTWGVRYGL